MRAVVAAALVAALLAGCGGDDEPASDARTATAPARATTEPDTGMTQSITTVPKDDGKAEDTDAECAKVVAAADIPDGEASARAKAAAPVEQGLANVVSLGAKSDPKLKELGTAHVLLGQLYGGAGASPGQAQALAGAIKRLEPRMKKLAAAAGVPSCALDPVVSGR